MGTKIKRPLRPLNTRNQAKEFHIEYFKYLGDGGTFHISSHSLIFRPEVAKQYGTGS